MEGWGNTLNTVTVAMVFLTLSKTADCWVAGRPLIASYLEERKKGRKGQGGRRRLTSCHIHRTGSTSHAYDKFMVARLHGATFGMHRNSWVRHFTCPLTC